ncbi:MAG: hypothetical protein QOI15_1492 [Pseudonocardiales bacterium]|nr:hypothetical protein [Pseudonocardiales bacterium]MDT4920590.1 hypothetical protein [Pseudonocardiales bacterium]
MAVAAIAALDDDVRRALFEHVRAAGVPVTREAAAGAVGISRTLAAFHLDKLVGLGLLRSGFGPPAARRVGRAPRVYEPAAASVAVCIPERAPDLLAGILIEAATGQRRGEDGTSAAMRVARDRGAALGARARAGTRGGRIGAERATTVARAVLADHGFEPYATETAIRLRNCPFHPLAAQDAEFVCGLNREYLGAMLDGIGAEGRVCAVLAPRAGECCVEIRPGEGD